MPFCTSALWLGSSRRSDELDSRISLISVFVGATAAGFGDILPTAFSGFGLPLSGVEFQANIFSADQQRLLIAEAPEWTSFALSLLVLVILALLLPRLTPSYTLIACMTLCSLLIAGYLLLLFYLRIQLPIINTVLLILFAVPIATGYRLAMTNRFLNQQLDDMASTPHLSLPQPAKRQPAQLLEHFQSISVHFPTLFQPFSGDDAP